MNATSCLEIFSLLIFNAATLGMILQQKQTQNQNYAAIDGNPIIATSIRAADWTNNEHFIL